MKRLLLSLSVLLVLGACATGGGGGGGGMAYTDCFTDYCVDYDDDGLQQLYLRTPGAPITGRRGEVTTATGRGGTQVVTRNPGATASASARMSPIPSARTSGGGGRRP